MLYQAIFHLNFFLLFYVYATDLHVGLWATCMKYPRSVESVVSAGTEVANNHEPPIWVLVFEHDSSRRIDSALNPLATFPVFVPMILDDGISMKISISQA